MLQVQDLAAGYGGAPVVQGVSFTLAPGGRLCVLGPNGSGKTTLLRALAGLLPCQGQVTLQGRALGALPARARARQVALLSQHSAAGFGYTAYETVMLGRYAHQRPALWERATPADRAAVRSSMQRTGTWALRDTALDRLSGGQQQRVFLARVFAQEPRVILLDEPANHLDLRYRVELVDTLREWAAAGDRCVVGVLHDLDLAFDLADTLLLLVDGRQRALAPAAAFDLALLDEAYGMDVRGYLRASSQRWR